MRHNLCLRSVSGSTLIDSAPVKQFIHAHDWLIETFQPQDDVGGVLGSIKLQHHMDAFHHGTVKEVDVDNEIATSQTGPFLEAFKNVIVS